jgi:hypothetical protein
LYVSLELTHRRREDTRKGKLNLEVPHRKSKINPIVEHIVLIKLLILDEEFRRDLLRLCVPLPTTDSNFPLPKPPSQVRLLPAASPITCTTIASSAAAAAPSGAGPGREGGHPVLDVSWGDAERGIGGVGFAFGEDGGAGDGVGGGDVEVVDFNKGA